MVCRFIFWDRLTAKWERVCNPFKISEVTERLTIGRYKIHKIIDITNYWSAKSKTAQIACLLATCSHGNWQSFAGLSTLPLRNKLQKFQIDISKIKLCYNWVCKIQICEIQTGLGWVISCPLNLDTDKASRFPMDRI